MSAPTLRSPVTPAGLGHPRPDPAGGEAGAPNALARLGIRFTDWAERWFPDAFVFVALAVVVVALGALANGAAPLAIAKGFGDGFWSLIPFTMQMAFVTIGGYVVATSPPVQALIDRLAALPRTERGAVALVAAATMLTSFLSWGMSLIFGGLLARAVGRRADLRVDYRAAGAAAYLGLGATWALGLSSSAAQLQANPASLTKPLLAITGVIPFGETIFLPQSMLIAAVLFAVSVTIAYLSAPRRGAAVTAADLGVDLSPAPPARDRATQPGEFLEHSPALTLVLVLIAGAWIVEEFARQSWITAISNLNTYNLIFVTLGLLLHWRPKRFVQAVAKSVPAVAGILIQYPLYAAIATMLTAPKGAAGLSLSDRITDAFVNLNTAGSFPLSMGVYSAVVGFFVPSGGGKWLLEAPYVMQAANALHVHLGWAVVVYNAAEALPNLVNPFWMLPLVGIMGVKARDIVGFSFLQLIVHLPLVLFLLWALAFTLTYHPPVIPG